MVSVIPLRKGSVLEAGKVRSMHVLSSDILMPHFVINHLGNEVPSGLSLWW